MRRFADAIDDFLGAGGKKRKTRAPKDPNAPRRPPNSYLLYVMDVRADFTERFPDLKAGERTNLIAARWREMNEAQRAVRNSSSNDLIRKLTTAS